MKRGNVPMESVGAGAVTKGSVLNELRLGDGSVGRVYRVETGQQTVAMSHFEQRPDALRKSRYGKSALGPLAGREDTDHGAQPGGIHVGHVSDVDDDGLRYLPSRGVLKVEERPQGQRTRQSENAGSLGTVNDLDFKFFRPARVHGFLPAIYSIGKFMRTS